jgi:hypothetical protein
MPQRAHQKATNRALHPLMRGHGIVSPKPLGGIGDNVASLDRMSGITACIIGESAFSDPCAL